MDAGFKSYVVMKAVGKIHGKRGRTTLIKLLRGSREVSVENMVQEFDLFSLWGIFSRLDREEVEDTLSDLLENDLVCIKDIPSGGYTFPMLHLTEEGGNMLAALEGSEAERMKDFVRQTEERRRSLEISGRGMVLDSFLSDLSGLLRLWGDGAFQDLDLTALLEQMEPELSARKRLEKFIYRSTPEKLRDRFRNRYTLNLTCRQLTKQIRELLGALPEQEAMMFRYHYRLQDPMYRPLEDLLQYYGLMEMDVHTIIKRMISRFVNRSYVERFPFIRSVMEFLDDLLGERSGSGEPLVKDTVQITYELYREGLSVSDIARERGRTVSTIYTHFIRLIPQYGLDPETILPKERIAGILRASDAAGEKGLKGIREQLGSGYSYGEIRLVTELRKENKAA